MDDFQNGLVFTAMKLPITCPLCTQAAHENPIQRLELTDDSIYQTKCSLGHNITAILWKARFELLIDFGVKAAQDGYYRESLANMAAALERFYEFYIYAVCLKRGIEQEGIKGAWATVSSQSERQLGAFLFLYLLENSQAIVPLSNKLVELRNSVVHKGRIPSRSEVVVFGERVLAVVFAILAELMEHDREWVDQAIKLVCAPQEGRIGKDAKTYAFIYHGVVNTTIPGGSIQQLTFEEAIEGFHDAMGSIFTP